MRNDNSNNSVLNNQDKEKLKDSILLPYELEVVEHLRNLETYIKNQYMEQKNSFDQKSLPSGKEIKIQIEIEKKNAHATPFKRLVNLVRDYSLNLDSKIKDIEILLLLLARILHFDRKVLWTEINNFINNKSMSIEQPFYEFRWENSKHYLVIKDYVAIPKDFVAAYFGYDTGIDGLNLLMDGGFLLPPDRSTYISISGEAGIGKTSLAIKLVTAFFQNYQFKNVYCKEKKLVSNNAELLEIHYILLEQKKNNIIRLIKECQLLDLDNTNAKYILDEKKLSTNNLTENAINAIIHFEDNVLFSPMSLIEKIEEIENLNKKNENPGKEKKLPNKRNVIVIDSVNAIQEMDIRRAEWRELFQGIKAITSERNTIVIFVGEKDPQQPDSIIEYLSDVVIKLYKDYKQVAFNRVIELVKSRFQKFHHGKHTFYLTKHDSGFIRIYPSSTALSDMIPPRKRVHPPKSGIAQSEREVGIKIDGIINFFKYSHLYSAKMEPFFLKNSITMFTGDRGTHKSAFAKKFALSAFRDERWETSSGTLMEFDYREREADKPWEEIYELVRQNARPKEKAAALLLYFSENYDEDPKKDIIWETYFGKIIIPGCKTQQRSYVGYISHIVCSYEVKDLTEDVYLYQLEELIRTIESYKVDEPIPGSYTEFINRKSLSLKNRVIERTKIEGNVEFNPYLFIYQGTGILNPQEVFDYSNVKKIKVSRMVLDDAENLENVYTTLDARKYISTLAHICMAREITLGIVNTRSKERTSIVDTVCNAVSDNAFKFDKYFFKGELFTTFNIIRSATSFHNNMLYYISKRDDGLLQLKNTFALLANVEKQNPEPIGIRLFLPDFSKEFSKNIYRLLVDRDIDLVSADNSFNKPKGVAKGINFASEFKIKYGLRGLETIYKPYHKFPSIYRDWHEFIKDMIIYSLAHPNVEIFTANDPFTDVSIILDDESAKDAITILCLPGYLMDLYEKNLTTISDYIHFAGEEDNVPVLVSLNKNNGEWISFTDAPKKEGSEELKNNVEQIKLGNEFYYLKKSAIRLFSDNAKDNTKDSAEDDTKDNSKCKNMHTWIIPEILFNIVVARDENNNIIRKKNKFTGPGYLDIKGYPYYIDPRVDLIFSKNNAKIKNRPPDCTIHNTSHDFMTLFFEIWFGIVLDKKSKDKKSCEFCFFEMARLSKKDIIKETVAIFVDHVKKTIEFTKGGLIKKLIDLKDGEEIVLREWYSSAQQKLKILEPILYKCGTPIHVSMEVPKCFLYTTWFLAIPVNSPRKETASEIIINVTQPHDLAYHQISGIGLQLSKRFYDKNMDKFYPKFVYQDCMKAMENLLIKTGESDKLGIPIDAINCYLEHLTILGGILFDFYRYYRNLIMGNQEVLTEIPGKNGDIDELTDKLIAFGSKFKYQEKQKKRCDSCYMTHLLKEYMDKKGESSTQNVQNA